MPKVLVIGIDGGAPQLIEQWRDKLPNFGKLMEEGYFGVLQSTVPPVTCPAWESFATGKNPGKLGLYDWTEMKIPYSPQLARTSISEYTSFWDILGNAKKDTIILNIPMSYPAKPVNGIMVSGWPATKSKGDWVYPRYLAKKLEQSVKGYDFESSVLPPPTPTSSEKYFNRFLKGEYQYTEKIFLATKSLMQEYPWDLLMTTFTSTDRIQHFLWHFMDKTHPLHPQDCVKSLSEAILNIYKQIDQYLGELLRLVDKSTYVIILSDHGFGPCHGKFSINSWLRQEGYLVSKKRQLTFNPLTRLLASEEKIRQTAGGARLMNIVRKLTYHHTWLFKLVRLTTWRSMEDLISLVDFGQTRAVGWGSVVNTLYMNKEILQGQEYKKVKEQLIESLSKITHPLKGEKAVTEIHTTEEIYGKNYVGNPPDIMFVIDDYRYTQSSRLDSRLWLPPGINTGTHRPEGLIMFKGPSIKSRGPRLTTNLTDLAPTILHIFGLPVPKDMDGRVLKELFREESEAAIIETKYQEAGDEEKTKLRKRIIQLKSHKSM